MHSGIERAVLGPDQASTESFYYDRIGTEIFARKRDVDLIPALLRRQRVESCQQKFEASFLGDRPNSRRDRIADARSTNCATSSFDFCAPGRDHVGSIHDRSIFRLHF